MICQGQTWANINHLLGYAFHILSAVFIFSYKPTLAISQDPKLKRYDDGLVLSKTKLEKSRLEAET